ncbi:MAG TPA: DUF2085 domain-containing protein [Balneolaceae bacterium]
MKQQVPLYLLILALMLFIVTTALGGGLFNQSGLWQFEWQHKIFQNLCHQNTLRSFWINGQPMAVCSRCLGIYIGFLAGWLLLPALAFIEFQAPSDVKTVLLGVILINLLDIVGNLLGFWQNTLVSRLVLGWLMGWTPVLLFSRDFFKSKLESKKDHHARITTDVGK